MMISQDYFDEVCVENVELFDLSQDDAVREALVQLGGEDACAHLVQSFPSPSCPERQKRKDFVKMLTRLTANVNTPRSSGDDDTATESMMQDLEQIRRCFVDDDVAVYSPLLEANDGWNTLVVCFSADGSADDLKYEALRIITSLMDKPPSLSMLQQFQKATTQRQGFIVSWKMFWESQSSRSNSHIDEIATNTRAELLSLVYWCCKGNQLAKQIWMQETTEPKLSNLLIQTLLGDTSKVCLVNAACKVMALLCTFDDAACNDPSVATAHSHVQSLHAAGAVDGLQKVLKTHPQSVAVLQAIKCLAIQNDIVQMVVSRGILQTVVTVFQTNLDSVEKSDESEQEQASDKMNSLALQTACLGLFRNLCANDDLKYTLCVGNMSIIDPLLKSMIRGQELPALQEQAIGAMAAMALRQPQNASFLLNKQAHHQIIKSMQRFPERVSLQRQGCLAIRNLASRSSVEEKEQLLAITRETLETVAAKHLQCQDEVYAALRDMGVTNQSQLFVVQDAETGAIRMQERATFGQGLNSNFRAEYDDN
jgi:hypothetical protein